MLSTALGFRRDGVVQSGFRHPKASRGCVDRQDRRLGGKSPRLRQQRKGIFWGMIGR
jgi:hypothetical protein